jgi:hypothetical protein
MSFLGLRKAEVEEGDWVWPARAVVDGVRNGQSEREARERAGASEEELRRWKRDPAYRTALRRARRGEGVPRFWSMDELVPDDPAHAPPPPDAFAPPAPGSLFGPMFNNMGPYR